MHILNKVSLLSALAISLTACGGGSGDGLESKSAQLTFAVSDSPENVQNVVIAFKNVSIKRVDNDENDGQPGEIIAMQDEQGAETEYRQVDLLQFQGEDAAQLFTGISLVPGDYQMCIYIVDGTGSGNPDDSYVVEEDNSVKGLQTPSNGSCAGYKPDDEAMTGRLKTDTFTIHAGNNYLVAEFNLMKVLKSPVGNKDYWTLKPTGYELVHADDAGTIQGSVDSNVVNNCLGSVAMAYLYPQTENSLMGDFRNDEIAQYSYLGQPMLAPLAAAKVNERIVESDTLYEYEFGFVRVGDYSIGYTCSSDDTELAEPVVADPNVTEPPVPSLIYQNAPAVNVSVIAGETVTAATISEQQ
ncbi:DUF4382 domain-containing protein [Psychromonas sp. MME2]|uniref:DUF4382 domain-containing protein n=1 Tax=unclassified Psychromonas TaxID=2614957 RepID=UPI00339CD706